MIPHDPTRIEEAVLALLFAGADGDGRAWKRYDFDAMGALFERGLISNPRGRAESVVLTDEGRKRGAELAQRLFGA